MELHESPEPQFIEIAIDIEESPPPELPNVVNKLNKVNDKLYRFVFKDPIESHKWRWLYYPTFTIVVTIVELALLIWSISIAGFDDPSLNWMLGPSAQTLVDIGGKWTPYILERGEWWRLISAMFLHAGIIHFITNMITQIFICAILELRYGTYIIAPVYILTGISGNLWSAIFVPGLVTVGASGALFGMVGMWTIEVIKHFRSLQYAWGTLISLIIFMLISFALGLLPYVDNYAHLGGYIAGLQLGILFVPNLKSNSNWKRYVGFSVRIFGGIFFLATFITMFCVLYLIKEPVSVWCPGCKYFNCIPNTVNGVDWCAGF